MLRCALYVEEELPEARRNELEARGIALNPGLFVPPLPGRHPHGFHLARVPLDEVEWLAARDWVVRLETTEERFTPNNDLARAMILADEVQAGECVYPRDGSGVLVAILDSGIDLAHGDFPVPVETYDVTDGYDVSTWDTDVANTVSGHGTHVTATALGRGTNSAGQYRGSAPGADLAFYKIGQDSNASAYGDDIVEAVDRANAIGADVLSMSYGGYSTYMDGSASICQAMDVAAAAGVTVLVSAGNEANDDQHDTVLCPDGGTSPVFQFTIDNSNGDEDYTDGQWFEIVWIDGVPDDFDMSLDVTPLDSGESLDATSDFGTSPRGTEAAGTWFYPFVPAGTSKTYDLTITDQQSGSGDTLVHVWRFGGAGRFDDPVVNNTITVPSLADGVISVGAWTQRDQWVDYQGNSQSYSLLTVDTLAWFSSRGPRIDGLQKPDIVSPGAATISARDEPYYKQDWKIIDDDGVTGEGSATYYIAQGTSMASPMAAGAAALLLEAAPSLDPAGVRAALTGTASQALAPDTDVGFGLIDARAAIQSATATGGCEPLLASTAEITIADGGTQDFLLDAGPANAGATYVLLGGVSGTAPGTPLDGQLVLPLNSDAYTTFALQNPNAPPLTGNFGALDPGGRAQASFSYPAGVSPGLAGTTVHHAYLLLDFTGFQTSFVSNAVDVALL